ncbi:MAG: TldD/PmbA family protein [Acidimicrobiia bacterium]|nr:TldD/PmbA family protein [Acidimicrobiia bacterium]
MDVDDEILARVLTAALTTGADFAEIFASDWRGTGVGLDDGKIEQLSTGRNRGAGIRVIAGETTGFAHTADLTEAGLLAAARVAAEAARQGGGGTRVVALDERPRRVVSPIEIDPSSIGKAAKVELLRRVDDAARSAGGAITQVSAGYSDGRTQSASVYKGKVGELVASPLVTLVDDGTMTHEWGAIAFDDEGHPSQYNVLIENGILTDYMWDFLRARKEGRPQSGNGRRQSYKDLPMVRMTNTYVLNGTEEPTDIIKDTKSGVYVAHLGGGSVNTATGDFVFGMTEAYLIEDGEITEPLREGNLIGNGPQVLRDIDRLGNDFAMGNPGTCGKDGQGVPVGDGQPTLRVKALTIGGTAA